MVSIITVVNNKEIYDEWLGPSVAAQEGIDFETVCIDNTGSEFDSLQKAYNKGLERAKGDWLMFVHPDVRFMQSDFLRGFIGLAEKKQAEDPSIQLFGVAGVEEKEFRIENYISRIEHGVPPIMIPDHFNGRDCVTVQTVDACCFIIRKETLEKYGFTDKLEGFHLIVEELCVRMKESGSFCAVLPVKLWHRSSGASLDRRYFLNAIKLIKMHPGMKYFNTTTMHGNIGLYYKLKLRYYIVRHELTSFHEKHFKKSS